MIDSSKIRELYVREYYTQSIFVTYLKEENVCYIQANVVGFRKALNIH
jgi:hypothetical protein